MQLPTLDVPDYDEILKRNSIEFLNRPGDLVIADGDLAITKWGDLMLNDEDYSSYFKFVQEWRFNYPTQRMLFSTVIDQSQSDHLENETAAAIERAYVGNTANTKNIKHNAWHEFLDKQEALSVAQNIYAGAIVLFLDKFLYALYQNIKATRHEWASLGPLFNGHSVGEALHASANNLRHNEEWRVTRPPTPKQMASIKILSSVSEEPIDEKMKIVTVLLVMYR